jgi:hypothetical protein
MKPQSLEADSKHISTVKRIYYKSWKIIVAIKIHILFYLVKYRNESQLCSWWNGQSHNI